jgi:hypothetical protein
VTITVKVHQDQVDELTRDPMVGHLLRGVAEKIAAKVHAPKDQAISVRGGVSRRGAFSQVLMRGPRAVFIEFGTRRQQAKAPLRSALRRGGLHL